MTDRNAEFVSQQQLKAKFSRGAAAHLVETPLSDDQVIESLDADYVCVTATVRDTAQLD